jgi:hypothetical protein
VHEKADPFEIVRREPDAIKRAKMAGELITLYQQRSIELARLRRDAINRAAAERNVSFTSIAEELGLTRGRISQIRSSAPPAEREFFGVGPVTVAIPLRSVPGRNLPVISSEDTRAYEMLAQQLGDLAFVVSRFGIPTDGRWALPASDVIAVCGPKSSPVTGAALEADPILSVAPDDRGRWVIRDRTTGMAYASPIDEEEDDDQDVAYLGRLPVGDRTILVIAGVHALGSVGAVHYLGRNLQDLYASVGTAPFSMVIGSRHDGDSVIRSKPLCPPRLHG